jgi:hypothetical protein
LLLTANRIAYFCQRRHSGTARSVNLSLVSPADLSASSILQFYIAADLGFSAEISVEPGILNFRHARPGCLPMIGGNWS